MVETFYEKPMRMILAVIFVLLFQQPAVGEPKVQNSSTNGIRLFLAGDTIITQPWSHLKEPSFLRLVDEIRGADVAIVNLETPIHEYKGYGQAESGGIHLSASPKIAFELAWAGIDMVSHANNHMFDYGSIGVLETLDNTSKAGLVLAGAGKDLQNARAPRYFKHPNGIVGLVSAAASFHSYNAASSTRPDMRGRPGLNPLRNRGDLFSLSFSITPGTASFLEKLSKTVGFHGKRFMQKRFNLLGMNFMVGEKHEINFSWGGKFDEKEVAANLAAIREARANADVVVFSIHAHAQGRVFRRMAHQFIDAGADVFFAHGPHRILGIEIYKGKPIFYGMGDFVFQIGQVERFPSEMYDKLELGEDATLEELKKAMKKRYHPGYRYKRETWESFAAVLNFQEGTITDFQLIPQDLGFGQTNPTIGHPNYADNELGKYIIDYAIKESAQYGTQIEYVESKNIGTVRMPD
jgi:hypothetical protein